MLVEDDARWIAPMPSELRLQLTTCLASFHNIDGKNAGYAGWLAECVVKGFLDAGQPDAAISAPQIQRS